LTFRAVVWLAGGLIVAVQPALQIVVRIVF
jgi:hypothetical protein